MCSIFWLRPGICRYYSVDIYTAVSECVSQLQSLPQFAIHRLLHVYSFWSDEEANLLGEILKDLDINRFWTCANMVVQTFSKRWWRNESGRLCSLIEECSFSLAIQTASYENCLSQNNSKNLNHFSSVLKGKHFKKRQAEPQRRDPSPRMDRHVNVVSICQVVLWQNKHTVGIKRWR